MTRSSVVRQSVAIADPGTPANVVKPNSDGSLNVVGSASGSTSILPTISNVTERSGAITLGGTSQQLAAALATRKYLLIMNPSTLTGQNIAAAESLFIRFGATAAGVNNGTSIELTPGGAFVMEASAISGQAIQVNAATTAHRWIAVEA